MNAQQIIRIIPIALCIVAICVAHASAQYQRAGADQGFQRGQIDAQRLNARPANQSIYSDPVPNRVESGSNDSTLNKLKSLHYRLSKKISEWGRKPAPVEHRAGANQGRASGSPQWREEYGPAIQRATDPQDRAIRRIPQNRRPPQDAATAQLRQSNTRSSAAGHQPSDVRQVQYQQDVRDQDYSTNPPLVDSYPPNSIGNFQQGMPSSSATYFNGQPAPARVDPMSPLQDNQQQPPPHQYIDESVRPRTHQPKPQGWPADQTRSRIPANSQPIDVGQPYNSGPIPGVYADGHMTRGVAVSNRYLANQVTASQRVLQLEQEKAEIIRRYNTVVTENNQLRIQLQENKNLLEEIQAAISEATSQLQTARTSNGSLQSEITRLVAAQKIQKQQTDKMLKSIQDNLDEVLAKELMDNQ